MQPAGETLSTRRSRRLSLPRKEDLVYSAVAALQCWLYSNSGVSWLPRQVICLLEIGFAIATRRTAALDPALWLAKWIYEHARNATKEPCAI